MFAAPLDLRDTIMHKAALIFFTTVVKGRECLFGNIMSGEMILNDLSMIVRDEWKNSFELRSNIKPDQYVIMPNHFHGTVWITPARSRGTARRAPTTEQFGKPVSGSLPTFIRAFKSATTRRINQLRNTQGTQIWQRNYYEHVIRNETELRKLREYILNNPKKWEIDRENPKVPWVKRQHKSGGSRRA